MVIQSSSGAVKLYSRLFHWVSLMGGGGTKTASLTFNALVKIFVGGGVKNGGKTIFIKGVGKVNKDIFHRKIKKSILRAAKSDNFLK